MQRALAAPAAPDRLTAALFRARGLRRGTTIQELFDADRIRDDRRSPTEVVFAASGTPWRPSGGLRPFAAAEPGTVRVATDIRAVAVAGGCVLSTETRVQAVDDAARRAFRRYWLVVGPFSGLIRRRWLRAAAPLTSGIRRRGALPSDATDILDRCPCSSCSICLRLSLGPSGRAFRGASGARRRSAARRLRGLRLRDDGNGRRGGRDRLARADPARSRRTRGVALHGARAAVAADSRRGDRGARDLRRRRRAGAAVRPDRRRAAGAARRCGLRRPQRELRPRDAAARVRAGGDRVSARRDRVHARGVPAAGAARRQPPAADDLRPARGGARRCARCDERRCATVALLHVLLDEGIAPETVELDHSAYMRLRSRGDTRPASEPQIRRVFGLARSAGSLLLDGTADREQVAALVVRVTGVTTSTR